MGGRNEIVRASDHEWVNVWVILLLCYFRYSRMAARVSEWVEIVLMSE